MRTLALLSRKGGSGKTTLAGHLAVEAEADGCGPVALVDIDPQGSLAAWWNERQVEAPLFAQVALHDLPSRLARLREAGVRLVIIDTPPAIDSAIEEVVKVTDFALVPVRPSPHDLRAVDSTLRLLEARGTRWGFALNGALPRARLTAEAWEALRQRGEVAPVIIHHRVDMAASMIDGRVAREVATDAKAAQEVAELWQYVKKRLEE
jgi:chromosome partitioning protein